MNIFTRSFKGLNLTPGERAFMKLSEGWLATAIGTGGAVGYQLLVTGSHDYTRIGLVAGGAASLSLFNAIKKYLAAQTDLPLPEKIVAQTAVDAAINQVQKIVPLAQPQLQFVPPAPMGTFNLLNSPITTATATTPFIPDQIRHFGDTGIVPAAGQVPRG